MHCMPFETSHPPRLYGIVATHAPIALIFRRGPNKWFHLLRWRLDNGTIEPGVWVKKRVYPRRCDLSSDGELMKFCLMGGFKQECKAFGGISRAPWLHPLASWKEYGSWGPGSCFASSGVLHTWNEPQVFTCAGGDVSVAMNDRVEFVNERRRGWVEAPDSPSFVKGEDALRDSNVMLQKACNQNGCVLRLLSSDHHHGGAAMHAPRFELHLPSGERIPLQDAAWAEWDRAGRLLIATHDGHLFARERTSAASTDATLALRNVEHHDLSSMEPNPMPAPQWAMRVDSLRSV
jgi:hypothetical protein